MFLTALERIRGIFIWGAKQYILPLNKNKSILKNQNVMQYTVQYMGMKNECFKLFWKREGR
jgi:hypothetical protein